MHCIWWTLTAAWAPADSSNFSSCHQICVTDPFIHVGSFSKNGGKGKEIKGMAHFILFNLDRIWCLFFKVLLLHISLKNSFSLALCSLHILCLLCHPTCSHLRNTKCNAEHSYSKLAHCFISKMHCVFPWGRCYVSLFTASAGILNYSN